MRGSAPRKKVFGDPSHDSTGFVAARLRQFHCSAFGIHACRYFYLAAMGVEFGYGMFGCVDTNFTAGRTNGLGVKSRGIGAGLELGMRYNARLDGWLHFHWSMAGLKLGGRI